MCGCIGLLSIFLNHEGEYREALLGFCSRKCINVCLRINSRWHMRYTEWIMLPGKTVGGMGERSNGILCHIYVYITRLLLSMDSVYFHLFTTLSEKVRVYCEGKLHRVVEAGRCREQIGLWKFF